MALYPIFSPPRDLLSLVKRFEQSYSQGELSRRDLCNKKFTILKPYASSKIKEEVEKVFMDKNSSEGDLVNATKMLEENVVSAEPKPKMNGLPVLENGAELLTNGNQFKVKVEDDLDAEKDAFENSVSEPVCKIFSLKRLRSSNNSPTDSPTTLSPNTNRFPRTSIKLEEPYSPGGKAEKSSMKRKSSLANGKPAKIKVEDGSAVSDSSDTNSNDSGSKKRKASSSGDESESSVRTLRTRTNPEKKMKKKRGRSIIPADVCRACRMKFNSPHLRVYAGHAEDACHESEALSNEMLSCLYDNEEGAIPENKLTQFSVYDENKHLCALDSGILESGKYHLYASGWVKQIIDEDPSSEGGIAVKDVGPISQWWVNEDAIGISTSCGDYYLMEPSPDYAPFMESPKVKGRLRKIIVDFLQNDENADATYVDLITFLSELVEPDMPPLNEETLLRHGKAVYEMIVSYDLTRDDEERELATTPCITDLMEFLGISEDSEKTVQRRRRGRVPRSDSSAIKKTDWSKATTTPVVSAKFESFFPDQLDDKNGKVAKKSRCGICEICQLKDCGTCTNCQDMVKFGGSGKTKRGCSRKQCPSMAVIRIEPLSAGLDYGLNEMPKTSSIKKTKADFFANGKPSEVAVEWLGDAIVDEKDKNVTYYKSATVTRGATEFSISVGDCVGVDDKGPNAPILIGRVKYLWATGRTKKLCHIHLFCRGTDTVLGESADPRELFLSDCCEDVEISGVRTKMNVLQVVPSSEWKNEGGKDRQPLVNTKDENSFFSRLRYIESSGRFVDPALDPAIDEDGPESRKCVQCLIQANEVVYNSHDVSEPLPTEGKGKYGLLKWKGEEFRIGQTVYIEAGAFNFKVKAVEKRTKPIVDLSKIDEDIYPEMYRKTLARNQDRDAVQEPYCIGLISSIHNDHIRVFKFYRVENTLGVVTNVSDQDLTKLFGSDEETKITFDLLVGKCFVVYTDNIEGDPLKWCEDGPDRFYFSESYDASDKKLVEPSKLFRKLGDAGKGGGKGKKSVVKQSNVNAPEYPAISRPLRCLDVFAGCGGLSDGLHQSGVTESMWAIEKVETAARAFKLNNPNAVVFTEDCNKFLRAVMDGKTKNDQGLKLPQKGEVEMIVGGPPCQGFSGMNRFTSGEYSKFKNSLIVNYLSFCDYYRPRFFLLENVRNFVSFKNSIVLKLTLSCLVAMGYQVAFGVLQAGNYGVPQTRRRVIIMAAAPGEILPDYPVPLHAFRRADHLPIVQIDNKKYTILPVTNGAPRRIISVYDALSDLPKIESGSSRTEMPYTLEPITHFQKLIRKGMEGCKLVDHICKEMNPIVTARIALVPKTSTGDWRDLPNIEVKLRGGGYSEKLIYKYLKKGDPKTERLRGVCRCATGKSCDPMDHQKNNTLIPWCLPHTGDRHHNWSGLYGRIGWDDVFSTTVTNPEPMGKQGRVLHPVQDRVVSVRECARSQGFPDKFRFYGTILDKHRQVGNAVPPPMGKAIGLEIRKSISLVENRSKNV
ncbi:Cytosine-specific methyltransferase [Nesidiocoris tenuis]|uniref:DNA (cytosine-5)-methyltransferase n=1 Tax=Nesidiocoris tenuis TaxID=355587 RepID=A0ABN7AWM4_9HEMI|nr:Cytosine-specific methyltransferase [Nesidiocoris tenuis]